MNRAADDIALDRELSGGCLEGCNRHRVVLDIAMPAQRGGGRDRQRCRLDAHLVILPGTQTQGVGAELYLAREAVVGAVQDAIALHDSP